MSKFNDLYKLIMEVINSDSAYFNKAKKLCEQLLKFDFNIVDYTKNVARLSNGKTDDDFKKIYRLQPAEDTLKFQCGTCWDICLCALQKLKEMGYNAYPIWYEVLNNKTEPNHMFIVIEYKYQFYIFEASMLAHGGIHGPYKKLEEIFHIYFKWQWNTKDKGTEIVFYKINSYPKPMTKYDEFLKQVRNSKKICSFKPILYRL